MCVCVCGTTFIEKKTTEAIFEEHWLHLGLVISILGWKIIYL
jgi:hypothetical protein